ncbi:MAG: uncharacterized protein JWL77_6477 [Chthonomonadaceae bacterium]|nr:uncharacterized protein [Chthonomonadaceae bacterium]
MKRSQLSLASLLFLLPFLVHSPGAAGQGNSRPASLPTGAYGERPLSFEPNQGQAQQQVAFLSHGGDYTLFLTAHEAVFATLPRPVTPSQTQVSASRHAKRTHPTPPDIVRMRLIGANAEAAPIAADLLPGHTNYLTGSDPKRWRTQIPNYAKVAYPEVYPGIALVYYGNQRRLEYDFVLRPHADPNVIAVRFAGAKKVRLDKNGALHLGMSHGEMVWHRPVLYQEAEGKRREIAGEYRLCRDSAPGHGRTPLVRFEVGAYDPALPLVIDPSIAYSTLLGGSQADYGRAITIDAAGNAYVAGTTLSADFPTTAGTQQPTYGGTDLIGNVQGWGDAFVTKFDHSGRGVFSTYIGGSGSDSANGIALSGSTICIAGATSSPNFPLTASAYQSNPPNGTGNTSAFVTALTSDGAALAYSTYLGNVPLPGYGSGNTAYDIAADKLGKLYIAGYSDGNFPVTAGAYKTTGSQNAFIAKLDITQSGAPSLVYGTYLGGSIGLDPVNIAWKIAVDSSGNAYVVGDTYCSDFPTTPGAFQPQNTQWPGPMGFVTKVNPTGTALVYSTFLPGASINGIAVDDFQYAYVTGSAGTALPTTAGAFQTTTNGSSAFIARFNVAGSALLYSTFLGNNASGAAIAVQQRDARVYVVGHVNAGDFPTTPGAVSKTFGGAGSDNYGDAFLTKMDLVGSTLLYSTYLGGAGDDSASGVAIDGNGMAYLTGITGAHTGAPNFPTTNQTLFGGGSYDAFVTRISTARPQGLSTDVTFNPDGTINPFVLRGSLGFDGITSPSEFGLLSSSNPAAAAVPASVNVPETQFGLFPINLHPVTVDTSVTISATSEGVTLTVPITVLAPHIASIAFLPSGVLGGTSTNGTVTLSVPAPAGGLAVTLTSSDPAVTVPSPVTVPAGASSVTFLANTRPVAVLTQVTVSATSAGDAVGKSGNLQVRPPNLSSLTLSPTSVKGGLTSTGTVTISDPAPIGGLVITLSSYNNAVAAVPTSVTIAAGAKTATFTINTSAVATDTSVILSSTLNGFIQNAQLTVQTPLLTSLTVNPGAVRSLQTAAAIVTLDGPAPTGGLAVALLSGNSAAATLPAYVIVPAGAVTATATVNTSLVTADTRVFLTATLGANNRSVYLTVQPHLPFDYNNDGHNDLVLQNQTTNVVALWYTSVLNILGGSTVNLVPASGWQVVGYADVNHDGSPDLLFQNQTTGKITVWYLLGTVVTGSEDLSFQPSGGYKVVGVGDFNNDGHVDLLFQQPNTGDLVIWFLNGATVIGAATVPQVPVAGYNGVGVGDFNNDGKPDIVFQNQMTNQVVVWYMNGSQFAGSGGATAYAPAAGWQVRAVEDLNGDGKADLVFQNQTTNQLSVWFMDGLMILGGDAMSITPGAGYKLRGPH